MTSETDSTADTARNAELRDPPFAPLESNPYSAAAGTSTECVVFDIGAEFGHFGKPQSAPSADTFGLPPRTTVSGLVAGMLGLPRDSYYKLFRPEASRVAVSVESPIRREAMGLNFLDTGGSDAKTIGAKPSQRITENRDPTSVSVLSRPRYRLYVSANSEPFMRDLDAVVRGADSSRDGIKPVYTPALGKARHLAWIDYVGCFDIEDKTGDGTIEIRSAVPGDPIPLVVEPDVQYASERLPAYMETTEGGGRVAAGSRLMTYDRSGGSLVLKNADFSSVGADRVVFE